MSIREALRAAWNTVKNILAIRTLWILFGGSSVATAFAAGAHTVQSGVLVAVFGTLASFAGGSLLTSWAAQTWEKRRYKRHPPQTSLEVLGGAQLTVVIRHVGLPVTVRVRAQMHEFPKGSPQHPEPYDVHLKSQEYGGERRSVELSLDHGHRRAYGFCKLGLSHRKIPGQRCFSGGGFNSSVDSPSWSRC
jgi:uncharacterized protein (DUF58 family)